MVLMLWRFQDMHMFADRHTRSISRGTHGISVAGAARGMRASWPFLEWKSPVRSTHWSASPSSQCTGPWLLPHRFLSPLGSSVPL